MEEGIFNRIMGPKFMNGRFLWVIIVPPHHTSILSKKESRVISLAMSISSRGRKRQKHGHRPNTRKTKTQKESLKRTNFYLEEDLDGMIS